MISGTFHLNLFVLVIQLSMKGLLSRPYDTSQFPRCPTTGVPRNGRRGSNVIYGKKPLFKLDMEDAKYGYAPGNTYEFNIKAQDPDRKFANVLLSMKSDSESCDKGSFFVDERHGQPNNCSHMVYKNTENLDHSFSFTWTAPYCGCVEFRARVTSPDGVYYLEDEGVPNGYLSKKICPRDMTSIFTQLPRFKRINILCAISRETSTSELSSMPGVLSRRKLNLNEMSLLKMEDLKINLQRRSNEIRECCLKNGDEQHECFGDIRRVRIDQFCEDGEPVIPFTTTRHDYMIKHKEDCCWKLGERRYACFAASGPDKEGAAGLQADWVKSTNELDESDPLNDIEDFPTELNQQLIKMNIYPKAEYIKKDKMNGIDDRYEKNHREEKRIRNKQPVSIVTARLQPNKETTVTTTGDKTEMTTDLYSTTVETDTTSNHRRTTNSPTHTTQDLFQKFQSAEMSYRCCNSGKQYGMTVLRGDYWKLCERKARRHSRSSYTKGRGKCRRFYHQCCVEQVRLQEPEQVEEVNSRDDDRETEQGISASTIGGRESHAIEQSSIIGDEHAEVNPNTDSGHDGNGTDSVNNDKESGEDENHNDDDGASNDNIGDIDRDETDDDELEDNDDSNNDNSVSENKEIEIGKRLNNNRNIRTHKNSDGLTTLRTTTVSLTNKTTVGSNVQRKTQKMQRNSQRKRKTKRRRNRKSRKNRKKKSKN